MSVANGSVAAADSTPLERDAQRLHAHGGRIRPGDIAIGVIVGRTSEFFDFFVFAIAAVLVFPTLAFGFADPITATMYSFGTFALAFAARPFGTLLFMWIDRNHGRGTKLTIALFLLGGSTVAMAFLPAYAQVGIASPILLAVFRVGQGVAWGGIWDGLPSLLALNAPHGETVAPAHLTLLGTLDGAALAGELAAQPIFVSAALFEPFGLAVLEAAQAGCPLVLAAIDTFRELWSGAALLVKPDDPDAYVAAIERLRSDPALRRHLSEAARARAGRYTPAAMAAATLAVYRDAAAFPERRAA